MRLGKVRLQLQGPAVAGDRFGNPMQGMIRFPQVVMEGSRIPFQPDRPSNVLDGNLVLAHLVSNHAEKMSRIGLIRFSLENLPIDLLGSLQPTGLMVLDRNRQCFGNRCHSTYYDNTTPTRNVFQEEADGSDNTIDSSESKPLEWVGLTTNFRWRNDNVATTFVGAGYLPGAMKIPTDHIFPGHSTHCGSVSKL